MSALPNRAEQAPKQVGLAPPTRGQPGYVVPTIPKNPTTFTFRPKQGRGRLEELWKKCAARSPIAGAALVEVMSFEPASMPCVKVRTDRFRSPFGFHGISQIVELWMKRVTRRQVV